MTAVTTNDEKNIAKTIIGKVVSNKMNKTIVVQIERKVKHPRYGKYVRRFSKMYAHDEENACQIGDVVQILQIRPLSKLKRWTLMHIVNRTS